MQIEWYVIWKDAVEIFSSANTPAWVQAIGSLVGLAIAIYVSKSPIKHAAKARRATIFAIAEAAHAHTQSIRAAVDSLDWKTGSNIEIYKVYHKSVIEGVAQALQRVPIHEIGTSKGVLALLSLTNQLIFLGSAVEELIGGPYRHPEMSKTLKSIAEKDYERHQKLLETSYSVLKHNVTIHLDQIDRDYEELKVSLRL